jgi:anti-sigma B factor antagonist
MIIERRRHDAVPEGFRVETRGDDGQVFVAPHGELDISSVDVVAARIDELVAGGSGRIVLDLRRTSFMDSSGLHLIIRQTGRTDARVTIVDGVPAVSRIFDLTGMRDRIPFETDVPR